MRIPAAAVRLRPGGAVHQPLDPPFHLRGDVDPAGASSRRVRLPVPRRRSSGRGLAPFERHGIPLQLVGLRVGARLGGVGRGLLGLDRSLFGLAIALEPSAVRFDPVLPPLGIAVRLLPVCFELPLAGRDVCGERAAVGLQLGLPPIQLGLLRAGLVPGLLLFAVELVGLSGVLRLGALSGVVETGSVAGSTL